MDINEHRHADRESLFVMADLRLDEEAELHRIKMRNLSAGGMMGDGAVRVLRGQLVRVNIRNVGWTEGTVAWVQDNRFGVAFRSDIDPRLARVSQGDGDHTPRYVKPPIPANPMTGVLRKI